MEEDRQKALLSMKSLLPNRARIQVIETARELDVVAILGTTMATWWQNLPSNIQDIFRLCLFTAGTESSWPAS
jgi:hypothetical protein